MHLSLSLIIKHLRMAAVLLSLRCHDVVAATGGGSMNSTNRYDLRLEFEALLNPRGSAPATRPQGGKQWGCYRVKSLRSVEGMKD